MNNLIKLKNLSRVTIGTVFVAVVTLGIGQANAANIASELIVNGGFETGDFTGWTLQNSGSGNWQINNGTFNPPGPGSSLAPISGNFDAVSFQSGPGFHLLTEQIIVPSNISSAIFSWSDRIHNYAGTFSDPNQEWRVLIENSTGNLIQEVFSTNPGDPLQQVGPNHRYFDLTTLFQSIEGQSIQVSFQQQDNLGFFNATLDNVSLKVEHNTTESVPEPASALALLVLGAVGTSSALKSQKNS